MPTYEYVCTQCGGPLEVVQSIHDPALTDCPACGGRLRKVFGNVGVVFKGSGFYRTDSRQKSTAATPAAKKPESTGDSAAAAKTPASGGSAAGSTATPAASSASSAPAAS